MTGILQSDLPDWMFYIKSHPLRVFCPRRSVRFFLEAANQFVRSFYAHFQLSEPHTEADLKVLFQDYNIRTAPMESPGNANQAVCPFIAFSEPDKMIIRINDPLVKSLAKQDPSINVGEFRLMILSHELFHILFSELEKPSIWKNLKRAECIIVEETAARLFSWEFMDKKISPFLPEKLLVKNRENPEPDFYR